MYDDTPPTDKQRRELYAMIVETDRLLRLLGEDPAAPVDLTALIAHGQIALDAVFATVLAAPTNESPRTPQ